MMAKSIHINSMAINVKIRASLESGTLGALYWDWFATRRKKR